MCVCVSPNVLFPHWLQVEGEMRELLSMMEQQKAASNLKVKQLATILQDMQSAGT